MSAFEGNGARRVTLTFDVEHDVTSEYAVEQLIAAVEDGVALNYHVTDLPDKKLNEWIVR